MKRILMDNEQNGGVEYGNYIRFLAMILVSMVVMYLQTYTNSWDIIGTAWFSETRLFMAMLMGGAMAIIMLTLMPQMYRDMRLNAAIYFASVVLMALALVLVRSQWTVDDVHYMEAMVPHHSIAVLTSKRAQIGDPRVRKLADGIIRSQQKEIKEMDWLVEDIRANGIAESQAAVDERKVPEFDGD